MNKKGQILTIDLLISLFIFILIFISVIIFLYSIASVSNPYSSYYVQFISNSLNTVASSGANTLIGSEGLPINWTSASCGQIKTLGILYDSSLVSPQKLYNLTTLSSKSPGCLSQLLRAGMDFNISVYYLNNSRVRINASGVVGGAGPSLTSITAGYPIPSNPAYLASIQRFGVLYPGNVIIRISYSEWFCTGAEQCT